jgi:hypothetical protein
VRPRRHRRRGTADRERVDQREPANGRNVFGHGAHQRRIAPRRHADHGDRPLPASRPAAQHLHEPVHDYGWSRPVALTQRCQLVIPGRIVGEGQGASRRQDADLALTIRQALRPHLARLHHHVLTAEVPACCLQDLSRRLGPVDLETGEVRQP